MKAFDLSHERACRYINIQTLPNIRSVGLLLHDTQVQEVAAAAIDESKKQEDMLPAEERVTVPEAVVESDTRAGVIEKAPRWTIGQKMAVIVVALATFVLGAITIGVVVHGYRASIFRYVRNCRMSVIRETTTWSRVHTNELNEVDGEAHVFLHVCPAKVTLDRPASEGGPPSLRCLAGICNLCDALWLELRLLCSYNNSLEGCC